MKVKEIMKKNFKSLNSDASIYEAAKIMKEENIGAIPILESKKCIGFLTDRDITLRCVAENQSAKEFKVNECMSKKVYFINENDNLESALKSMHQNQIRRLVVTNNSNELVGLINFNQIAEHSQEEGLVKEALTKVA